MSEIFNVPVDDIVDDTSPDTIERWDSIRHMQLVLALEEELGITFSDEQIPSLISLDAIISTARELGADKD